MDDVDEFTGQKIKNTHGQVSFCEGQSNVGITSVLCRYRVGFLDLR